VTEAYWDDWNTPAPGGAYFYLVRSKAPNLGSWGADSSGTERTNICLCGDGTVQGLFEQCDDWNVVDDGNGCDETCQRNDVCGDGTVQDLFEPCDDGNAADADGETDNCMGDCTLPRYINHGDGTVTDTRSNLVWLRDASCADIPLTNALGMANWEDARDGAHLLEHGTCGLSDGSAHWDWRLPTRAEWENSVQPARDKDCTQSGPGFPPTVVNAAGTLCHSSGPSAFYGVMAENYWSSTGGTLYFKYTFDLLSGSERLSDRDDKYYLWPIRNGP
jgi:cysteine-rich repeat protein